MNSSRHVHTGCPSPTKRAALARTRWVVLLQILTGVAGINRVWAQTQSSTSDGSLRVTPSAPWVPESRCNPIVVQKTTDGFSVGILPRGKPLQADSIRFSIVSSRSLEANATEWIDQVKAFFSKNEDSICTQLLSIQGLLKDQEGNQIPPETSTQLFQIARDEFLVPLAKILESRRGPLSDLALVYWYEGQPSPRIPLSSVEVLSTLLWPAWIALAPSASSEPASKAPAPHPASGPATGHTSTFPDVTASNGLPH